MPCAMPAFARIVAEEFWLREPLHEVHVVGGGIKSEVLDEPVIGQWKLIRPGLTRRDRREMAALGAREAPR